MQYFSGAPPDPSRSNSKSLSLSLSKKRKLSAAFNDEGGLSGHSETAPQSSSTSSPGTGSPARSSETSSSNKAEWKTSAADDDGNDDDCIMLDNDDDDQFWNDVVDITDVYADESKKDEHNGVKQSDDYEDEQVALMKSLSVSKSDVSEEERPGMIKEEPDIRHDTLKQEEEETPFIQSTLSASKPESSARKRKPVGEDVFTESCVKEWQGSRIKAWEGRYLNPEGYYYRFVVPGEGQQNGGWSKKEHAMFMERYNEWISRGWKIGASWGLFSRGIPHRVGYQCMNYYRKLVSENKLKDDSYAMVDGKLKQIHKERAPSGEIPTTELGPEWESEDVKQVERNVDQWLKQYHKRSGMPSSARPAAAPKKSAAPRFAKTTTPKRTSNISDLVKKQPPRRKIVFLDDEEMLDGDASMEGAEPEQANLRIEKIDWEKDWRERLEKYREFMQPFLDPIARHQYWLAKQEWRQGLATTEMLLAKKPVKNALPAPVEEKPAVRMHQMSLAAFYKGVKERKADTPDELISNVRIPNELFSGVHQITTLASKSSKVINQDRYHYFDVDNMLECVDILDVVLGSQDPDTDQRCLSPLEGILIDPPWEFYVKDGRNDGRCSLNIKDMMTLMEKVLSKMTAGLVFIWTHKLIQADVVRLMASLDCKYVENLVWFKKSINNVPLDQPSPYFSSAKEILLMFKKGDGFELRHQRTADVIIDFEKPRSQWINEEFTEPKPEGVYDMIETLLPCAGFNETLSRGRLLELWAKKSSPRREGWISFHQNKPILPGGFIDSQIPSQSQQPSFVS